MNGRDEEEEDGEERTVKYNIINLANFSFEVPLEFFVSVKRSQNPSSSKCFRPSPSPSSTQEMMHFGHPRSGSVPVFCLLFMCVPPSEKSFNSPSRHFTTNNFTITGCFGVNENIAQKNTLGKILSVQNEGDDECHGDIVGGTFPATAGNF